MLEKDTFLKPSKGCKVYQTRLNRKQFKKAFPELKTLKVVEVRVEWLEDKNGVPKEFLVSNWQERRWVVVAGDNHDQK
jgi:hypothetical protein